MCALMFGHGRRFVDGKWPPTWYDASAVLEALAPYPTIWKGKTASAEDEKSTTEIARALAITFGADGMVTPRSCVMIAGAGFEPRAVPFEHGSYSNTGHEVFLGLRPLGAGA